ncbi:hypothetical protein KS4_02010 [Poriferisphaera corsica]|uniref:Uncharacterized protein n=1 Tax=Poriferisphaera corsica TaxID=2528020 RepID=A0A517YPN0_9BACT|nr:hypothetical protein KS4_02010 [Poriferisphaera corsica]
MWGVGRSEGIRETNSEIREAGHTQTGPISGKLR